MRGTISLKCISPSGEECLFLFRHDELIALTVNIDNLNLVVILQVLAQLRDVDVHRARIEVVVINPDCAQRIVALENLIGVRAQQGKQFVLLGLPVSKHWRYSSDED